MRRLINLLKDNKNDGERGGVIVIVAIAMVVLLGFTAIAVDVGMLYSEKAQLKNGSDAAALAIAQKCAKNSLDTDCTTSSTLAKTIANGNAVDGLSNIKSVALDKTNRTVTVTAGAQEQGHAANSVSLKFAQIFGMESAEVTTASTVQWGSPTAGPVIFPLAFSVCQVSGMVNGAAQLIQNHTSGNNASCNLGPAGKTVPGGFAWITQNPGSCGGTVDIDVNKSVGETGGDAPSNCSGIAGQWAADLTAGKAVTVLFPVYNDVIGTGTSATYDLLAFAAFSVKGWKFASGNGTNAALIFHNTNNDVGSSLACTGSCRGIIGSFVKYVSLADGYKLGPVSPYGATVVKFSS